MILNVANVLGLTIGGLILAMFGYTGFFLFFGSALIAVGVISFIHKSDLKDVQ